MDVLPFMDGHVATLLNLILVTAVTLSSALALENGRYAQLELKVHRL